MTVIIDDLLAMVTDSTEADVNAAVADYSSKNPPLVYGEVTRSATDDKSYPLPANFGFLIRLDDDKTALPTYFLTGNEIRFTARPYADTIGLWYGARHVANDQREYPLMADDETHIIALKLKAIVASRDYDGVSEYKIGDVSVKGGSGKLIDSLNKQYEKAVAVYIGAVGMKSAYSETKLANAGVS